MKLRSKGLGFGLGLGLSIATGSMMPSVAMSSDMVVEVFPKRPITLVVGYPPGGAADTLTRLLAVPMAEELGQKVIIENRPGAGGNVGAAVVAKAAPDGYTIFLAGRSTSLHKVMYQNLTYDFAQDFVPVGMVASVPYVVVAGSHIRAANLGDAIALTRAQSRTFTCASGDLGSTAHLLYEMLDASLNLGWQYVPYRGDVPALMEAIAGRADFSIITVPGALPHIRSGRVRPLAVFADERVPVVPYAPLVTDYGDVERGVQGWFAVVAPTGTPSDAIARLNHAINKAVFDPALRMRFMHQGYMVPPVQTSPEELGKYIDDDRAKWTAIIEARGMKGTK